MNIFSKKPSPKEVLRDSKREMTHATRGIEKEISALQSEEKKLVAEIKRTAKSGNEAATKILARQLVRLRQQIANLQGSRAQMRGIATHTQAIHAQTSVAAGMKGATKAMTAMNKQMAPAKQAKVIQDFQKQSAQMDMITEMMSDAIDDALDDDEAEEETDELTNQVSLLNVPILEQNYKNPLNVYLTRVHIRRMKHHHTESSISLNFERYIFLSSYIIILFI
nr:vacuolar protein sorting-associated protein 2 homolog 3 isoform X1 [Ipomoea trifida]